MKSEDRVLLPDEIAELLELDEGETLVCMARLCLLLQDQLRSLSRWLCISGSRDQVDWNRVQKMMDDAKATEQTESKENPFRFVKWPR